MADATLLGDLRERPDGGYDGWCWAPDRPAERLLVDLLVNDTVAASMVAAIYRRDLMLSGYGDGHHGFALRLPPRFAAAAEECLVTARERRSGAVFGRVLRHARGEAQAGGARLEAAAQSVAGLWQGLAAADPAPRPALASDRLRAAFAALGTQLAAGPRAAPPFLPQRPALVLAESASPALSILLPVSCAETALRRIAALAPGIALAGAEIVAVDMAADPCAALLPAQVRGLRYLRDPQAAGRAAAANVAAAHARGAHLVLLGDGPANPSAAALLALARIAAAEPASLLIGPAAAAAVARVGGAAPVSRAALPGRLDLAFCIARDAWIALGPLLPALQDGAALECADLAARAALLGMPVHAVGEPAPLAPAAVAPAAARAALAAYRDRWQAA